MTARGPKALAVLVAAACSSSALAIDDAQAAPCPGETTLEIKVDTVPGEQVSENNEATYTVVFE